MKKIQITTPSDDFVRAGYVSSLIGILGMAQGNAEYDAYYLNVRRSNIAAARHSAVRQALLNGATHIMWIDSDVEFPFWAMERLISHDLPIVGATYNARRSVIAHTHTELPEKDPAELAEVQSLPGGFLLVKTEVYKKTGSPFYRNSIKHGEIISEDVDFSWRAREHGFKVILDRQLTGQITHLGEGRF